MNINRKQKVTGAAAAVVMLVGGGSAVAATRGGHGPGGGPGDPLAAAASYLGISESTLRSDLQSGKTLAEIANATSGKSASGLIAALVAKAETDIEARVTAMVNGSLPVHGPPPGASPRA